MLSSQLNLLYVEGTTPRKPPLFFTVEGGQTKLLSSLVTIFSGRTKRTQVADGGSWSRLQWVAEEPAGIIAV